MFQEQEEHICLATVNQNGFRAKPYHGKMDRQEKAANQNAFHLRAKYR